MHTRKERKGSRKRPMGGRKVGKKLKKGCGEMEILGSEMWERRERNIMM